MSERAQALELAFRAGFDAAQRWGVDMESEAYADWASAAPPVGVSPQPDEQYRKVLNALGEFYSMVRGECPSLLEDDLNAFEAWSVLDDAKWFDSPELLPASLSPAEPTPEPPTLMSRMKEALTSIDASRPFRWSDRP